MIWTKFVKGIQIIFKIAVTGSTNQNHVSWAQLSIVYKNNTACTLCFFSSQEKLGSHGFRQLSCVSRTAATWASGSADHYQHQHLALPSFFQAELNFLLFPETGNAMCTSVEFGIKYFWNQLLFLQDVLEWWFILWFLPLGNLLCEFLWNLQGLLFYRATCLCFFPSIKEYGWIPRGGWPPAIQVTSQILRASVACSE